MSKRLYCYILLNQALQIFYKRRVLRGQKRFRVSRLQRRAFSRNLRPHFLYTGIGSTPTFLYFDLDFLVLLETLCLDAVYNCAKCIVCNFQRGKKKGNRARGNSYLISNWGRRQLFQLEKERSQSDSYCIVFYRLQKNYAAKQNWKMIYKNYYTHMHVVMSTLTYVGRVWKQPHGNKRYKHRTD